MRTNPTVTVSLLYTGKTASGRDRNTAQIRLRGNWIEEIFNVGERVTITQEIREGKPIFVLQAVTEESQP